VRATDLLVASSRFPTLYTGRDDPLEALRAIRAEGPRFVAMTRGKDGAIALTEDGRLLESAGFAVDAVDTTGAGDVFHGAFTYGFLKGWSVEDTLRFANAAAAINCTALGARGGVPGLTAIKEFMG